MMLPNDEPGKLDIYLSNGDLPETVDAIEALLVERDPQICQGNHVLYVKLADGPVRANAALLRIRTMRRASFYKTVFKPDFHVKPVDPPLRYFEALLRKGEWKFPALDDNGTSGVR